MPLQGNRNRVYKYYLHFVDRTSFSGEMLFGYAQSVLIRNSIAPIRLIASRSSLTPLTNSPVAPATQFETSTCMDGSGLEYARQYFCRQSLTFQPGRLDEVIRSIAPVCTQQKRSTYTQLKFKPTWLSLTPKENC